MSLSILSAGLLTTIQDLGRTGYQKEGVVVGGAMDARALRLGNALVGNPATAAGLEITLLGPKIRFDADHLIALTGADLSATIQGEPVPRERPVYVRRGSVLAFGAPRAGCRAYLAVAGGIDVAPVLGSRSTYVRARLGGLHGTALQADDVLPCPAADLVRPELVPPITGNAWWSAARWAVSPRLFPLPPMPPMQPVLRVVRGPEYALFSIESRAQLQEAVFTLAPASDRMGYRLLGPALALETPQELLSSAVTFGTVQVPPDGNPIILLADRQTTGGYPRLAQVVSADFSWLAQLPLGQPVRFQEITLAEAQRLYLRQEQLLRQLEYSLRLKIRA